MRTLLHKPPRVAAARRDRRATSVLLAGGAIVVAGADGRPVHRTVPAGAVLDGEVVDVELVAETLRQLAREHHLPRRVRVAVADPRSITRVLRLPAALEGDELTAAARFAATDVLPVGADDLTVGVGSLGPAGDGGTEQRALLAVGRREGVERLQRALARARMVADRVEPAGCALARAHGPTGTTLRVDVGAVTTVAVSEDGRCSFAHVAQDGVEAMTRAAVDLLGMDEEHARTWVHAVGAAGVDGPVDGDAAVAHQVRGIVRDGLAHVAGGVRNALAFHSRSGEGPPPLAVVLSGTAATWPDVQALLARELELPVDVAADPAGALLDGLGRAAAGGVDLRVAARLRPHARPVRTGRALPAAVAALVLLCGGLATAVQAHRGVAEREQALAAERATVQQLERDAAILAPYGRIAAERAARERAAEAVVARRLPWERVLDDLAAVAPARVRLRAVRLTPAPDGRTGAGGARTGGSSGVRASRQSPAIELSGCAPSHPAVARYLDALLDVRGVTTVALDRGRRDRAARGARACADQDGRVVAFTVVAFLEDAKGASR